jgi:hypothetical protein
VKLRKTFIQFLVNSATNYNEKSKPIDNRLGTLLTTIIITRLKTRAKNVQLVRSMVLKAPVRFCDCRATLLVSFFRHPNPRSNCHVVGQVEARHWSSFLNCIPSTKRRATACNTDCATSPGYRRFEITLSIYHVCTSSKTNTFSIPLRGIVWNLPNSC